MARQRPPATDTWYYAFLPNNAAGGSTSPIIPLFVTDVLRGNIAQVGAITAVSSVASVPSFIVWGNLSDYLRRRRAFVMVGFVGMAISMLAMGLSSTLLHYFVGNLLLGLLATAAAPIGTVLVLELSRKEEWAPRLGRFSAIGGAGWVVGLVVGAFWMELGVFGWDEEEILRSLFLLSAALALLSAGLAARLIPEPASTLPRRELHLHDVPLRIMERAKYLPNRVLHVVGLFNRRPQALHRRPDRRFSRALWFFLATSLVLYTGFTAFYVAFPIFLNDAGIPKSQIFVVYLASSVAAALTYGAAGRLCQRWGARRVQLAATSARVLFFPSFILVLEVAAGPAVRLGLLLLLHAIVGVCWALISVSGNALASELAPDRARGEALGLFNAITGAGAIVGALVGGVVAELFGFAWEFVAASALVLVGTALLAVLPAGLPVASTTAAAAS